jgi:hypothetical protein
MSSSFLVKLHPTQQAASYKLYNATFIVNISKAPAHVSNGLDFSMAQFESPPGPFEIWTEKITQVVCGQNGA